MKRRNRNLGRRLHRPNDNDYLSAVKCMDWLIEVTREEELDVGWAIKWHGSAKGSWHECIRMWLRIRDPYVEILHAVVGNCCKEMIGREEVFCLRRKKGSIWATLTKHIVGECPIAIYEEGGDWV